MIKEKVVVVIGEGRSETSFFTSFIKKNFNFINDNRKGNTLCKENTYVFLSHPIGNIGGVDSLTDAKTYIKIDCMIKQNFKVNDCEIFYLILADTDGSLDKEKKIKRESTKHIKNHCPLGNIYNIFAIKKIENRFLAGLGDEFNDITTVNIKEYDKIIKKSKNNIELLDDDAKRCIDVVLPKLSTLRIEIGRQFGKHIDIEKAKNLSPSFRCFLETLQSIFGSI